MYVRAVIFEKEIISSTNRFDRLLKSMILKVDVIEFPRGIRKFEDISGWRMSGEWLGEWVE